MKYITIKRFHRIGMTGETSNIPYGTEVTCEDNIIHSPEGKPICVATSAAAHEYFAINEDNNGLERGKLTQAIIDRLSPKYFETREERDKYWERIWNDELANKYRKQEHETTWLWNTNFYNAGLEDLKYLANLAGCKGVESNV